MDETVGTKRKPKIADYKAALEQIFQAIDRSNQNMEENRVVIDRLKVETQILKAESDIIKAQTQERLDALRAAVK